MYPGINDYSSELDSIIAMWDLNIQNIYIITDNIEQVLNANLEKLHSHVKKISIVSSSLINKELNESEVDLIHVYSDSELLKLSDIQL